MKNFTLLFITAVLSITTKAQTTGYTWVKSQNGAGNDVSNDVVVSSDNFVYSCGYFSSAALTLGSTTLTNTAAGFADIFLAKYDTAGNLIWVRRYGNTGSDVAVSIAADSTGNIYVAGKCSGTVSFGTLSFTGDAFILKIDAAGVESWITAAATNVNLNDIAADPAGNTILCGKFAGTASIGGTSITAMGGEDGFVAKYNNSGAFSWMKCFYNNGKENCSAIAVSPTGIIAVGGNYDSPNKLYIGNALVTDSMPSTWQPNILHPQQSTMGFRCSLQPNGDLRWAKDDVNSTNDWANITFVTDIAANANGDFYFASSQSSRGLSSSWNRGILRKYNSAGTMLWEQQLGFKFWNFVANYTTNPSVNVAGGKVYAADQCLVNLGAFTWGVRAFTESGNLLWGSVQTGNTQSATGTNINSIAADINGVFVSGLLTSSTLGNLMAPYLAGNDGYVARITGDVVLPPLALSLPLEDIATCSGGTAVLAQNNTLTGGQQPYTVQWTSNAPYNYLSNTTILQPTLNGIAATASYFLSVTDAAGAQLRDTLIVNVEPPFTTPVISLLAGATMDTLFCNTPHTNLSYKWSTGVTTSTPELAINNQAVYSVTISRVGNPGCKASSAPFYYKILIANAGRDTIINQDSSAMLGGYPEYFGTTPGTATYSWTPVTGLSNSTDAHPIATPDTTTNYVLALQDGTGYTKVNDTVRVVVVQPACPGGSISFTATNIPPMYVFQQWQVYEWGSFKNIVSGDPQYTNPLGRVLTVNNPPTWYYGNKYRCISSDGFGSSIVSNIFVLKFGVTWTGAVSQDWHNPANWSCGVLPDNLTDVVVKSGTPTPIVSSDAICHKLKLMPGVTVTVNPGVTLTITGQ